MPRRWSAAVVAVACVSGVGCGRPAALVPACGRVVFGDGQPVAGGTIEFRHRGGGPPARSAIDRDGRFCLRTAGEPGAAAGDYDVLVLQLTVSEGVVPHVHRGSLAGATGRRVHARHARAGASGLTATVGEAAPEDLVITVEPLTAGN